MRSSRCSRAGSASGRWTIPRLPLPNGIQRLQEALAAGVARPPQNAQDRPAADEFAAADARSVVADALSKLSPRQRAAIVLTELLGYSSESAGEILGVRPVTIRVLASQGRAAMKRTLEHKR